MGSVEYAAAQAYGQRMSMGFKSKVDTEEEQKAMMESARLEF